MNVSFHGKVSTSDAETDENDGNDGQSGLEKLLQHMRNDQNIARAAERWHEASEIQHAIVVVLDASAGPEPGGLNMDGQTESEMSSETLQVPPQPWSRRKA